MHIYMLLAWLYIGSGFIVLEHSTHLVWTRRSSHDAADVIVLWITEKIFNKFFFRRGGFWGVWGAPRPHPGVARGRKTIHFFL